MMHALGQGARSGQLAIAVLRRRFLADSNAALELLEQIYAGISAYSDQNIFTHVVDFEQARAQLNKQGDRSQPLFGIPFAVKDNIDVAGIPTTAGCPSFAFTPSVSAPAVQSLMDAGAVLIGKTNLDQFATGLVGTRSPYGACPNPLNPEYISGGSSSGSAVAVAQGLASFALGTDTAGSGRVPAAFCNLVGLKPTRGRISTRGVVPACRTLDCISVFGSCVDDVRQVLEIAGGYDADDPFARRLPEATSSIRRIGIPREPTNHDGNEAARQLYLEGVEGFRRAGLEIIEIDTTPFTKAAALLYSGPWVAERYAAVGHHLEHEDVDPAVRQIIQGGKKLSAVAAFRGQYELAELRRAAERELEQVDALLFPTAPTAYLLEEVRREPLELNSRLGWYTNFVNLLDLAALALPVGFLPSGVGYGVTLIATAGTDAQLLKAGRRYLDANTREHLGANDSVPPTAFISTFPTSTAPVLPRDTSLIAVAGAHLEGQPLHHELSERGASLFRRCRTAKNYRLLALSGSTPPKPGLVRDLGYQGPGIEVEVYALPSPGFADFITHCVKPPLAIAQLELEDGESVPGFICEPAAQASATDITELGSWRAFMSTRRPNDS